MGSCFSRRKRSDAAVTHNASPRSSFSASCKGDTFTSPSPIRALKPKPSDEIVKVLTKDSASLLANTQNSVSLKKPKSKNAPSVEQTENANMQAQEKGNELQSKLQSSDSVLEGNIILPGACQDVKDPQDSHGHEAPTDKALQCNHIPEVLQDVCKAPSTEVGLEHTPEKSGTSDKELMCETANQSNAQDKQLPLAFDDEFVVDEIPASMATLKRSRSCEEALRVSESRQSLRRRSFQEISTFSPRTAKLETIPEPHFGTTKYLEGLDLVDVLPDRSSQYEAPSRASCGVVCESKPTVLDLPQHESNGFSADFFTLKNRYLLSCSAALHNELVRNGPLQDDDGITLSCNEEDNTSIGSFDIMHSRASSMDSAEHMDMVSSFPSTRHPISAVKEEDEDDCPSDDSEMFEFKHAVSIYGHEPMNGHGGDTELCSYNEKKESGVSKDGKGLGKFKELSVVATGDAVLYTGSNSEEFDLIPSKSFVRGSPKMASNSYSGTLTSNQHTLFPKMASFKDKGLDDDDDDDEEQQLQSSLSVDDIIFLLERDELDEEVLLSFLNLAKSTTTASHGGNIPSCHMSDVASEASFEFKVKSSGSTPHSTPSTPMLSAGSTPKRITQLSPLVLTSEEIAEIWGVFEQRQAISPFQM